MFRGGLLLGFKQRNLDDSQPARDTKFVLGVL